MERFVKGTLRNRNLSHEKPFVYGTFWYEVSLAQGTSAWEACSHKKFPIGRSSSCRMSTPPMKHSNGMSRISKTRIFPSVSAEHCRIIYVKTLSRLTWLSGYVAAWAFSYALQASRSSPSPLPYRCVLRTFVLAEARERKRVNECSKFSRFLPFINYIIEQMILLSSWISLNWERKCARVRSVVWRMEDLLL